MQGIDLGEIFAQDIKWNKEAKTQVARIMILVINTFTFILAS